MALRNIRTNDSSQGPGLTPIRTRRAYPPRRFEKYAWINRVLRYNRRFAWLCSKCPGLRRA